ncbi:MAG: hypothetical protein INR73_15730 [Williamsia sp.]|nr:hypothetical protein [Williamsia sp.]
MMKFVVSLLLVAALLPVQAQNQRSVIKGQALEMARALLKKDFPAFSKFVHPKLVAAAGGTNKLVERLDSANALAKQFGAEIKKIHIGDPKEPIAYKNTLQTTLPQSSEMATPMGNVVLETTLIALSADGGKNWQFLDTSVFSVKEIKRSVPELSPDLVIPPQKPPKIIPNQQQ